MRLGLLFICSLFFLIGKSQPCQISVIDSKTDLPVPYAALVIKPLERGTKSAQAITDVSGKAFVTFDVPSEITVVCLGYQNFIDTLTPATNHSIALIPKRFDVDEVVLTGQYQPEKADKSIYQVRVISGREIERKASTNMSQLLSNELSFQSMRNPVWGAGISIQGLSGNNVKFLRDGIPIIGRLGGQLDLEQLILVNVDHIETIEGPASVIYGTDALGGAINIISKSESRMRHSAHINTFYETSGVYNANATLTANRNKHTITLTGGRHFFDGFSSVDTTRTKEFDPREQYFSDLWYTWRFNHSRLRYNGAWFRELIIDKDSMQGNYKALDYHFLTNRYVHRLDFEKEIGQRWRVQALAGWSAYSRARTTFETDLTTLEKHRVANELLVDTTTMNALTFRGVVSHQPSLTWLTWQSGFDYVYEEGAGPRIFGGRKEIRDGAIFLSAVASTPGSKKISVQPGLRLTRNSLFEVPGIPSLNLRYAPKENIVARVSYARGFRSPTIKELYIDFHDINHNLSPNAALQPETGNNFNFSVKLNTESRQKIHYSHYVIGGFFNDIRNNITIAKYHDFEDITVSDSFKYVNLAYYKTLGYVVRFEYEYYQHLTFSAGFTHTGLYYSVNKPKAGFSEFKFSPSVVSTISWLIPKSRWTFSLLYKYTGRNLQYEITPDEAINEFSVSGFHNVDATVLKKLWKNHLDLSFGARNIFDVTHLERDGSSYRDHAGGGGNSIPMAWGRTFFIKLAWHFYDY